MNDFSRRSHLSNQSATAEVTGQIERITYVNEDTGYTVAKVVISGNPEPVTVVGNLLALSPGEVLEMKGVWETHPKFGRQFRILEHRTRAPASVHGMERYLGSGLIKGIGPVMASRIIQEFGEKTLEVLDRRMEDLARVEGIGPKRLEMIREAWAEQKEIRGIMVFLQEHGVGPTFATKIYRRYGQRSIAVVSQNPYRLAVDIPGIGFQRADTIAGQLGFEKSAPVRAEAGILYVLNQMAEEGHVFYPYPSLMEKCRQKLELDREAVAKAIQRLVQEGSIVAEEMDPQTHGNGKAIYLARFHLAERGVSEHVHRLRSSPWGVRSIQAEKAIPWVQQKIHLRLAAKQVEAVRRAISDKIVVITGGPGTGKTTIIHAVIQIYRAIKAQVLLAAPTGRAAKRMSETTGATARTIHRLLEFSWQKGGFQRDEKNPLDVDVIILDEASMIDIMLMHHLLRAVPSGATLILVGDVHQLPSVGPGTVLRDIIVSRKVSVVTLREVFRQAQKSLIVTNAHRIHRGILPTLDAPEGGFQDFYFIEQEDPEQVLQIMLGLISQRIPHRFGMSAKEDIQALSPMHKGPVGTKRLNQELQAVLNPDGAAEITRGETVFRKGDKVMQVRNNYEKEVFNGDIGIIQSIDRESQEVVVAYDTGTVVYDSSELDEIVLAYAATVHKSQGSEYPAVVLPILSQHYLLLQRNLLYTAVTRARRLVVLVGSKKALAMAVRNESPLTRYSLLAERLTADQNLSPSP
jgi:exodeoxyribonuclease V alpha subunit